MEKGRGKGRDTLQTDNVFTHKEYIEREAALALYEDDAVDMSVLKVPVPVIIQNLKDVPAADVRPVVRCADCKYNRHCFTQSFVRDESIISFDPDTWFCADGKRMDGDGE